MPLERLRMFVASAVCGFATLAVLPFGCAGSVEQARVHRPAGELAVPNITAERLRECVDRYQEQLTASDYKVRILISNDEHGRTLDMTPTAIAEQAPDFAACTRVALRDMQIPEAVYGLRTRASEESSTGQTSAERNRLGTVTTAGAEIALEELIAAAGGTTVVFVVAIVVVAASGVADIADGIDEWQEFKAQCHQHYLACLASPLADKFGSVHNATRCDWCREACVRGGGVWPPREPAARGYRTCKY